MRRSFRGGANGLRRSINSTPASCLKEQSRPWRNLPRAGVQGNIPKPLLFTVYTAIVSASSSASRFRAMCKRRLMVPTGEANASLISSID